MNFLRKIKDNVIIRVELLSIFNDAPLIIDPQEGNFSLNQDATAQFNQVYFTVDSCYLTEDGKPTDAGDQYLQQFGFKIPTNKDRVEFLKYFKKLKTIRAFCSDGTYIEMGRNDFHQNTVMKAAFSTDGDFTKIDWSIQTIFPFDFKI